MNKYRIHWSISKPCEMIECSGMTIQERCVLFYNTVETHVSVSKKLHYNTDTIIKIIPLDKITHVELVEGA